jgi:hypothetical protein
MDFLKSWGITVCLAALAAGIAGIIAPTGKMEKVYKFAVSLFFLCCLLVPLFSLKNITLRSVQVDDSYGTTNSGMNAAVSEQAKSIAEQNVTNLVESCCRSCGTVADRIDVQIAFSDGKMSVSSVEVKLKVSDKRKLKNVQETIKNKLGLDATVSV